MAVVVSDGERIDDHAGFVWSVAAHRTMVEQVRRG
jgi:hypothetical protein